MHAPMRRPCAEVHGKLSSGGYSGLQALLDDVALHCQVRAAAGLSRTLSRVP